MSLPLSAIPRPITLYETTIASKIESTDTSLTLSTATDDAGNAISGVVGLTCDGEVMIGTKSGTSVTGLLRGIDPQDGTSEVTALKAAHQRGAVIKITAAPFLNIVYRLLNGAEGFPNQLKYVTSGYPTPVNDYDIPTKAYVLSVAGGSPVSQNRVVVSGTAGETLTAGNLVYLKAADARWWKCDADTAATVDNIVLGIAQGAGTAGASVASGVLVYGRDTNNAALTAGSTYYAGNTAGAISSSVGTTEVTVGQADVDGYLFFAPRYNQQLTEDQQDALAGTSGTPSASNAFVTANDVSATAAASKIVRSNGSSKIAENYLQTTDANMTDLTDGGKTSLHTHNFYCGNPGLTTDGAVTSSTQSKTITVSQSFAPKTFKAFVSYGIVDGDIWTYGSSANLAQAGVWIEGEVGGNVSWQEVQRSFTATPSSTVPYVPFERATSATLQFGSGTAAATGLTSLTPPTTSNTFKLVSVTTSGTDLVFTFTFTKVGNNSGLRYGVHLVEIRG